METRTQCEISISTITVTKHPSITRSIHYLPAGQHLGHVFTVFGKYFAIAYLVNCALSKKELIEQCVILMTN